ncbi:MAG TPA: choice-of-anchor D domain-containing protein, partial [Pseudomonadales bacterium]|nr:choice-of-anchor D domain-containing protein [Pseudomonadales bacterium]
FAPTASGAKSDNISLKLNGVTYKNIAVSGSALNLNNASTLVSCLSTTSIGLSWTASASAISGIQYIVFVREGAAVPTITTPVNASTYTANSNYTAATTYGNLGKVVYKGSSLSANVTGLTANAQYTFKVVAYKNETGTIWSSSTNSSGSWNSSFTMKVPDANITQATIAPTSSKLSWSRPTPTSCYEVLVVANQGSVSFTPTGDGSAYTANSAYTTANQVVYKGMGFTFTVSQLEEDVEYCYKIFVRNITTNQWSLGTQICQITGPDYCVPIINNTDNIGITQVKFNTINNTSLSSDSYTDYTNTVSTIVLLGESYPLEVNVNVLSQQSHTRVWIDWNRNGTFETSELLNLDQTFSPNTQAGIYPINVYIPTNAYIGGTRMRVATQHFDPDNASTLISSPCPTYTSGEVEDYLLIIQRPIGQEILVKANNQVIDSGSTTTNSLNNTLFAQRNVGTTSTPKTYIIESIGTLPLHLTGSPKVTLSGANAGDFSITTQPTSPVAAEGGSTTFEINFTPSDTGLRTAIVSIANGDTTGVENPYTFAIHGTGNGSTILVTGNNIPIPSGNTTISQTDNTLLGYANLNPTNPSAAVTEFKISNGGTTNLEINDISLTGAEAANFSVQPTVFLIEPGSFESFIVTFDPATSGAKNATINITSSGSASDHTFAIQ